MNDTQRQLVSDLLSGKRESLTQGGAYSVDRLKSLTEKARTLVGALEQANARLVAVKAEIEQNRGAQVHCAEDIVYWEGTEDDDEDDDEDED